MKRLVLCSLLATLVPFHAMAVDAGSEDSARFARAMTYGLRPSTAALGAAVRSGRSGNASPTTRCRAPPLR